MKLNRDAQKFTECLRNRENSLRTGLYTRKKRWAVQSFPQSGGPDGGLPPIRQITLLCLLGAHFSQLKDFHRHCPERRRWEKNKTHAQHQNHTAEMKWLKPYDFKSMHLEIALFRWNLTTNFHKVQGKPFLISRLKRTAQTRTITPGYQLSSGNGMLGSSSFLTFSQQQARLVLTTHSLQHTTLPSLFLIFPRDQLLRACLLELFPLLWSPTLHIPLQTR